MAHECYECGQACYCDGEDTWVDCPSDCECARRDQTEADEDPYDDFDDDPDWYEDDEDEDVQFPFVDETQMTLDDEIRSDAP